MVLLIGVCGSSGSGKSTISNILRDFLENVVVVTQDSFYIGASGTEEEKNTRNYDVMEALDFDALCKILDSIKNIIEQITIPIPIYDFKTHSRIGYKDLLIKPESIVIIEGILIFAHNDLPQKLDLRVYVDALPEICFYRRVIRDIKERGRDINEVFTRYMEHVKPSNEELVYPSKEKADMIVENNQQDQTINVKHVITEIFLKLTQK